MKLVRFDDVEEAAILSPRQGTIVSRQLVQGDAGTPGNFGLTFDKTSVGRFSPRHRHNFDQFRYQIDGENDFDRDGTMTGGMLGYFPEGTFYGPQNTAAHSVTIVLQVGGASGEGYMSNAEKERGIRALQKVGVFEKGVFRRNEGEPGKKNMDGYQATWEFINGRPMVYQARYSRPVLMDVAKFDWRPIPGLKGAYEKNMGVFTERRTLAQFLKLEPGVSYQASGRALHFMLGGDGAADGRPYGKHDTLHLEDGEKAVIAAKTETQILVLGLPEFADGIRQAAE